MRRLVVAGALAMVATLPSWAGDVEDRSETLLKTEACQSGHSLPSFGQAGHIASAQVGVIYYTGQGVRQDYAEAVKVVPQVSRAGQRRRAERPRGVVL